MRIASGTLAALSGMDDSRAQFVYDGDLGQMGKMYEFLRGRGMPVVKSNVYPGFAKEEDFIAGLKAIYASRVDGWWNQQDNLIKHGICTQAEYGAALTVQCEQSK